ncbi:MAG: LytTR family DNA-binding domain-containing protein [Clostridiales Family XIII bacterium]|jgi:DNA-binding LytR/AlgR family response regulator|nr:LytTR family DNA-binding domain-containing protein [Clostridiales Family XIII bacterium]
MTEKKAQDSIRIAICEDLDADALHLAALISASETRADVTRFESGEEFLASFSGSDSGFDLIFLDVYMKELTGIETARTLRERGVSSRLVFTTTSPDFSLDAFDVDAEQYLVKPLEADKKMTKVLTRHFKQRAPEVCSLSVNGQVVDVPLDIILYAEAKNHNCLIYTTNAILETGRTMTFAGLCKILSPPRFVRSHRSYLVNLSQVASVDRDFHMKNGDTVLIARGDVSAMKNAHMNWLLSEAIRESE